MAKDVYAERSARTRRGNGAAGRITVFMVSIALLIFTLHSPATAATRAELQEKIIALASALTTANAKVNELSLSQARLIDVFKLTNAGKASLWVIGVATGTPGANMTLPISHLNGPDPISALQFDLVIPASFTVVNVTAGQAALDAGKVAQYAMVNGNTVRVMVYGMNQNAIGTGVLVNVILKSLPATPKWTFTTWFSATVAAGPNSEWVLHLPTVGAVTLK